ncbi:MAG: hydrolase, partial [Alphaproteobacteria bacterium]|nr:hydrolase [Alphaproteobacteria bacterium]
LLRGTRPEMARFRDVARAQAAALAARGVAADPDALYAARLVAAHAAYRLVEPVEGEREGRHALILDLVCRALRLDPALAAELAEVELACETRALRGNMALAHALARHRRDGRRVVFTSDMYLPASAIGGLIAHHLPQLALDGGYSSADFGVSKRGGGLFRVVAEREGVQPAEILHFGDSWVADVATPRAMGIHVLHTPRPRLWRHANGLRHRLALLGHRAIMRRTP